MAFYSVDVKSQEEALTLLAKATKRATLSPLIRETATIVTNGCNARDDVCELDAIFRAVKEGHPRVKGMEKGVRYMSDPIAADYFIGAAELLRRCARGACSEDCLPNETLVLKKGYVLDEIANLRPGDTIMGDGGWTRVLNVWDKGVQPILEFKMDNGCVLRCTGEHRVFRVPKGASRAEAEEVRASELKPGDNLLTVDKIPYGVESMAPDKAYLMGLHIADGWIGYSPDGVTPIRVGISGLDGKRKEDQKHKVKAICEKDGMHLYWNRKYVSISDKDLAVWLAQCGRRAIDKHVPSLNLDEATLKQVLVGLDADRGITDGVFSTISKTLAIQMRLIARMEGRSSRVTLVENHGGFGKNPIYRVKERAPHGTPNAKKSHDFATIQSISDGGETPTTDIETESKRFYLPETDLVVHNCDSQAGLIAALAGALGFRVGLRAYRRAGEKQYSHVYAVALLPKLKTPGVEDKVVGMDSTVPSSDLGWEPPNGKVLTAWIQKV